MLANLVSFGVDGTFDVAGGLDTGKQVISWAMGIISDNSILAACFVLGTIIPCGIAAFAHFKSAAR